MMTQKAWVLDDADFFVETQTGQSIRVQSSLVEGGVLRWTCECVADESGLCKHVITSLLKSAVRSVYDTLVPLTNAPRKVRFQNPDGYVRLAPFSTTNVTPSRREEKSAPIFDVVEAQNKDEDSSESYVRNHPRKHDSYEPQNTSGTHFDAVHKKRFEAEYTERRNNPIKRPIDHTARQEPDYHHSPVKKGRVVVPMNEANGRIASHAAQVRPTYPTDQLYHRNQTSKCDWVETQDFRHHTSSIPHTTESMRNESPTRATRRPLHKQVEYEEASNESVVSMHLERLRKPGQAASRSPSHHRPILRRAFAFGAPAE